MRWLICILGLLSFKTLASPPTGSFDYVGFNCLVENAWQEARGEKVAGMQAVTQVVLNRMRKSGESACTVVYKPWAFSWTMDKKRKARPASFWATEGHTRDARWAAVIALRLWPEQGDPAVKSSKLHSKIYRATHYHSHKVKPKWASQMKFLGDLNGHRFYEEKKRTTS